jgi:hypothetical protein
MTEHEAGNSLSPYTEPSLGGSSFLAALEENIASLCSTFDYN